MIDRTGQQLDDYQLLRLLDQGTFGAVYEGEHLYLKTHELITITTSVHSRRLPPAK